MGVVFLIFKIVFFGIFGLVVALFVLALVFGKRIVKQWEFEAEFRDENGREVGEFDIELSRIAKEGEVDTFKASFCLSHDSLAFGQRVQVFLDEALVLEGHVETAGHIQLANEHIVNELTTAHAGQVCRVRYGGREHFSAAIEPD